MATLVSFWSLFGNRMADLSLIDSKLGLYITINVNNRQNKFEVHISKNVAKMAILWPKIGQRHFCARASHGHNLAIFHQILTNEHTKMTSSLRRIEWNTILSSISLFYILVFWPHFCSEASHGQCCTYGLKTTLKLLVHVLAIMASSYLKIVFQQKSGLNPPPLNMVVSLNTVLCHLRGGGGAPGVRNPLKISVTGPSLLVNCYLEIKFHLIWFYLPHNYVLESKSELTCILLRERSHMTSARFWQILPSPSPCQQLSALSDPPDDVSICQTPPPISK